MQRHTFTSIRVHTILHTLHCEQRERLDGLCLCVQFCLEKCCFLPFANRPVALEPRNPFNLPASFVRWRNRGICVYTNASRTATSKVLSLCWYRVDRARGMGQLSPRAEWKLECDLKKNWLSRESFPLAYAALKWTWFLLFSDLCVRSSCGTFFCVVENRYLSILSRWIYGGLQMLRAPQVSTFGWVRGRRRAAGWLGWRRREGGWWLEIIAVVDSKINSNKARMFPRWSVLMLKWKTFQLLNRFGMFCSFVSISVQGVSCADLCNRSN